MHPLFRGHLRAVRANRKPDLSHAPVESYVPPWTCSVPDELPSVSVDATSRCDLAMASSPLPQNDLIISARWLHWGRAQPSSSYVLPADLSTPASLGHDDAWCGVTSTSSQNFLAKGGDRRRTGIAGRQPHCRSDMPYKGNVNDRPKLGIGEYGLNVDIWVHSTPFRNGELLIVSRVNLGSSLGRSCVAPCCAMNAATATMSLVQYAIDTDRPP